MFSETVINAGLFIPKFTKKSKSCTEIYKKGVSGQFRPRFAAFLYGRSAARPPAQGAVCYFVDNEVFLI